MKLYHGSNQPITEINLSLGKKFRDFGQGFYTTHSKIQADSWSKRISERYGGFPYVTIFEFDLEGAKAEGLNIKIFEHPNEEWALFVMNNRRREGDAFTHNYDIVIGPVADDDMARLFSLYDTGIIDLDVVLEGLIFKRLNSQYFFGTERSLKFLKKI